MGAGKAKMQYLRGAAEPSNNSLDIYRNLQNIEIPFISHCFILTFSHFNENEKRNYIHLNTANNSSLLTSGKNAIQNRQTDMMKLFKRDV